MTNTTDHKQGRRMTPAEGRAYRASLADPDLILSPESHTPSERMPFVVCPTCEGYGFHINPALDGMTLVEVNTWYGDDHSARKDFVREYNTRGGAYDVRCGGCDGERVTRALCECDGCEEVRRLTREAYEEEESEKRFGC